MSAQNAFVSTSRFKSTIALLNGADAATLEKVASTIVTRLGDASVLAQNGGSIFSDAEREQLRTVLSLPDDDDLDAFLSGISYIWDQSAFYNLSADKLVAQLAEHAASEDAATALGSVWRAQGAALISRLRERMLGAPRVLRDVDWRLQLTMAHGDLSKTKVLNAVLDLTLADADAAAGAAGAGSDAGVEHLRMELDKAQMARLFQDLEKVQSQLDQITK